MCFETVEKVALKDGQHREMNRGAGFEWVIG